MIIRFLCRILFIFSEIRYDCFVVNLNPLKLTIENQLRRLYDAMISFLKRSIIQETEDVDKFANEGLQTLNDRPKTLDEISESFRKHDTLNGKRREILPLYQRVEAKNRLLRSVAGTGHEQMTQLQVKLDTFEGKMNSYIEQINEQKDQLKKNVQDHYNEFIKQCEKVKLRWQQFRPRDQDMEDEGKCRNAMTLVREKEKELEVLNKQREKIK